MTEGKIIGSATASNNGEIYKTSVLAGGFELVADEPLAYGGNALGPAPADYLCTALASCKAITVRMYARRKGWNLKRVDVHVNFVRSDATGSAANTFFCELKLSGELTDEQRKRMLEIAKVCPVERLLGKGNGVETVLAGEEQK